MCTIYVPIVVPEMLFAVAASAVVEITHTCIKVVRGLLLLLLLFVIVCRMTQLVAVFFLELIPVFLFFNQTRFK